MRHKIKSDLFARRILTSLCAGALVALSFADGASAQQPPDGNDARVVTGLDIEKLAKNCADARTVIPKGMFYSIPTYDWQTDAGTISVELAVADSTIEAERLRYPEIAQTAAQLIDDLGESGKTGLLINGEIVSFRQKNVAVMLRGLPPERLIAVAKKIDGAIVAGGGGVSLGGALQPILIEIPVRATRQGEETRVPITLREGDRVVRDYEIRFSTSEGLYAQRDPHDPHHLIYFWDKRRPTKDREAVFRIVIAMPNGRLVSKELTVQVKAAEQK
jgi:hypothetical protein